MRYVLAWDLRFSANCFACTSGSFDHALLLASYISRFDIFGLWYGLGTDLLVWLRPVFLDNSNCTYCTGTRLVLFIFPISAPIAIHFERECSQVRLQIIRFYDCCCVWSCWVHGEPVLYTCTCSYSYRFGLTGTWVAMKVEVSFRGTWSIWFFSWRHRPGTLLLRFKPLTLLHFPLPSQAGLNEFGVTESKRFRECQFTQLWSSWLTWSHCEHDRGRGGRQTALLVLTLMCNQWACLNGSLDKHGVCPGAGEVWTRRRRRGRLHRRQATCILYIFLPPDGVCFADCITSTFGHTHVLLPRPHHGSG